MHYLTPRIFVAALLLSACTVPRNPVFNGSDIDTQLPLKFWNVQEAMAEPTEKQTEPFPCQPAYFTPAKDLPTLHDGESTRVTFGNVIVDASRTLHQPYFPYDDQALLPYTIIEYSLRDPHGDCRTGAIEVFKDGKFYALYSHIYQNEAGNNEWIINPMNKQLVIHSRRVSDGKWIEQVRRIDLETKQSSPLPLHPCFTHARVLDDGSLQGGFQDLMNDGAVVYCGIDAQNQLQSMLNAEGIGGSTVIMPTFNFEKRLFSFIDPNSQVSRLIPDHHMFVVVSLDDPHTWIAIPFDDLLASCGEEEIDLSDFSFEVPHVRYRYPLYDTPCMHKTGQMSEWISLP